MSSCGEGAEWVEQLRAPRQGHCTSQSQPVKATLLRRAVTLCATVARWLRRQNRLIWYYLVHDNFFVSGLDWGTIIASLNGKPLTLSPMEYKMLNLFRKNPRQVLTRGQLLEKLWDIDERFVDEHTLTTSISRIRSKIESDGGAPYIKTVYGMGYQWTGGEAK